MWFRKHKIEKNEDKSTPLTFSQQISPVLKNIAMNGAKSYIFGSFVGLINSEASFNNTLSDMHRSGLKFMSLGMIYTGSESLIETVREKKCVFNLIGASAIAGGIVLGRQSLQKGLMGAVGFGLYTGLNHYSFDTQKELDSGLQ